MTEITLDNLVKVVFSLEELNLERITQLTKNPDFVGETEEMRRIGDELLISLLVYDDVLAKGSLTAEGVYVTIQRYSDTSLLYWVDYALSQIGYPIRVIDKTTKQKLLERLKPRTELDWIEYDAEMGVIEEREDKQCSVERYLRFMPLTDKLYALTQTKEGVEVLHLGFKLRGDRINGEILDRNCLSGKLKDIEKTYRKDHPGALVVVMPLSFCASPREEMDYFSCVFYQFLEISGEKIAEQRENRLFD